MDGILVQSPLPEGICEYTVFNSVAPEKDVDAFHILNTGKYMQKQEEHDVRDLGACSRAHTPGQSLHTSYWELSGWLVDCTCTWLDHPFYVFGQSPAV